MPGAVSTSVSPVLIGPHLRRLWLLDDDVVFLNHGSFGATPIEVLDEQLEWRRRMERQPVRFLAGELPRLIRRVADELGEFVGTDGRNVVPVDNATTGVNAVIRSLRWEPGGEIVATTHGYGAVRKALLHETSRTAARLVEAAVPFPIAGSDEVVEAVEKVLSAKTKLLVVDHVTSFSALVLPVKRLVALARERGIATLIDGAHAPGMLPLHLDDLGADYYVGNCHKWLFAPKGCAFLWASRERQRDMHPTVVSHGYGAGFTEEFDWTGTKDPTPWLCLPAAIAFGKKLGWDRTREHNTALAAEVAAILCQAWGCASTAPGNMRASMATFPHPASRTGELDEALALHERLWTEAAIEVPVMPWGGRCWIRISAQVYNELPEYERLAKAVLELA